MIEERQRQVPVVPLQPQGHLAEVHGQGVQVHPVDAVLDHIPHGPPELRRRGLLLPGADPGKLPADTPGCGQEEVSASGGRIADAQAQKGMFSQ